MKVGFFFQAKDVKNACVFSSTWSGELDQGEWERMTQKKWDIVWEIADGNFLATRNNTYRKKPNY